MSALDAGRQDPLRAARPRQGQAAGDRVELGLRRVEEAALLRPRRAQGRGRGRRQGGARRHGRGLSTHKQSAQPWPLLLCCIAASVLALHQWISAMLNFAHLVPLHTPGYRHARQTGQRFLLQTFVDTRRAGNHSSSSALRSRSNVSFSRNHCAKQKLSAFAILTLFNLIV
eukprot:6179760-Pleurochrysis_carterae.AAC.2